MAKNWIAGAINPSKKGALHKQLGVPQGDPIPVKKLNVAASKGGTLGRRARLAKTLEGLGGHKAQAKTPVTTDRGSFKMKG